MGKKQQNKISIPVYIINWTDKYFHQSAFNVPLNFPSKKIINFLSQFNKNKNITLYRGCNQYNKDDITGIKSWTYSKVIASRYAVEGGKIIKKSFKPEKILLDTTTLNEEQKIKTGYNYKIDDKEVLVFS